jgi:hypothetical protein
MESSATVPDNAKCDICNSQIHAGGGHSFYSSVKVQGTEPVGNMLLCDDCTLKIVNDDNWAKDSKLADYMAEMRLYDAIEDQRGMTGPDILAHRPVVATALREANEVSIVYGCKLRGFTPEQAKAKGRELAIRWWDNPQSASAQAAAFWTAAPVSTAPSSGSALTPRGKGCLIGCGVLGAMLIMGCIALVAIAFSMMEAEKKLVRTEAQNVLQLLGTGKASDAFAATALAYRAETDQDGFEKLALELGLVGFTGWEEAEVKYKTSHGPGWSLIGYATGPGGRVVPVTMEFVKEGEKWKVRSIRRTPAGK